MGQQQSRKHHMWHQTQHKSTKDLKEGYLLVGKGKLRVHKNSQNKLITGFAFEETGLNLD